MGEEKVTDNKVSFLKDCLLCTFSCNFSDELNVVFRETCPLPKFSVRFADCKLTCHPHDHKGRPRRAGSFPDCKLNGRKASGYLYAGRVNGVRSNLHHPCDVLICDPCSGVARICITQVRRRRPNSKTSVDTSGLLTEQKGQESWSHRLINPETKNRGHPTELSFRHTRLNRTSRPGRVRRETLRPNDKKATAEWHAKLWLRTTTVQASQNQQ